MNPFYLSSPLAEGRPDSIPAHDDLFLRSAAARASRLYPGATGELISRELLAATEFGYWAGREGLAMRVARQVMAAEVGR